MLVLGLKEDQPNKGASSRHPNDADYVITEDYSYLKRRSGKQIVVLKFFKALRVFGTFFV